MNIEFPQRPALGVLRKVLGYENDVCVEAGVVVCDECTHEECKPQRLVWKYIKQLETALRVAIKAAKENER